MFVLGWGLLVSAPFAWSQPRAPERGAPGDDGEAVHVDTFIVTGTRVAGRTTHTSVAPIDVLSNDEIRLANKGNLLEALNTTLPSFNLPNVLNPNVGSMIRAGQLRGLNPDHTLVLVNGKRRHSTAFLGAGGFGASAPADLSLIPSGSIERIEILRDGASALYGSDAIAGVINIITRTAHQGGEVSFRAGQHYEGDGLTRVGKAGAGFRLGREGYLHVAVQVDDQQAVVRNSPVPSSFLFYFPLNAQGQEIAPIGLGSTNGLPQGATPSPKEATRDNNAWVNTGSAAFRLDSVSAGFGIPVADRIELYGFSTYGHRKASAVQNFRTPSRNENVRAIYPDGFNPVEAVEENDFSLVAGLRSRGASNWTWDLSGAYGNNRVEVFVYDSINPTYGLLSPTDFYIGANDYASVTTNLDVRGALDFGGIPLDVAVGAEHRHERFKLEAGDPASYSHGGFGVLDGPNAGAVLAASLGGSQALPGFRPGDEANASRNAHAAYAGLSLKPAAAWVVDLAGRYEDYSDFGETFTGRLSTRYDFARQLSVRATVSNGFHAPALAAQYYKNTANQNTFINHTLQVISPEARALGAQPLEPEKSRSYSLGLVSEPVKGLHLALDAYEIEVDGRISTSTTFREAIYPGVGALVEAAGYSPGDGIRYFINAVDTRTRGVDFTAETVSRSNAWGQFRWTLAGSYTYTEIVGIASTPPVLEAYNVPIFSAANQTTITYLGPRLKGIFGAHWSRGKWNVSLRETYYGVIKRLSTPATIPTTGPWAGQSAIASNIDPLWVTDLDVTYRFNQALSFSLNINNLFDVRPNKIPAPLLAAHQSYSYPNFGPVSGAGGFYSGTVTYRF